MKTLSLFVLALFLAAVALVFMSCASPDSTTRAAVCQDSLYVQLSAKPLNALSANECAYYLSIDKQCREAQKELDGARQSASTWTYTLLSVFIAAVSYFIVSKFYFH